MRPWNRLPILDNEEPLDPLPEALLRLTPHPYMALGAPYGTRGSPFRLRRSVVARLLDAQEHLQHQHEAWRLAIFDAWRPLAVQAFMVQHAVRQECCERGIDPDGPGAQRQEVIEIVSRFWAPPSDDPATPPPHSTGAAVDLTLAGADGLPLPMGGEIDAIGAISEPDHYAAAAHHAPLAEAARWHQRRQWLRHAMESAGFVQHPNEWWHFSHGDQLWAWRRGQTAAIYGRVPEGSDGF